MSLTKTTLFAATALVSFGLTFPAASEHQASACLSAVESHRALLEQGQLKTLDMDQDTAETGQAAPTVAAVPPTEASPAVEGEVTVQTKTKKVTVPVGDGEPRESWFGKPPSLKTVEEYLDGAETAAKEGDEAACLEQLSDARTASMTASE